MHGLQSKLALGQHKQHAFEILTSSSSLGSMRLKILGWKEAPDGLLLLLKSEVPLGGCLRERTESWAPDAGVRFGGRPDLTDGIGTARPGGSPTAGPAGDPAGASINFVRQSGHAFSSLGLVVSIASKHQRPRIWLHPSTWICTGCSFW